ncbi:MAG: DNA-binding protein YbiB [Rhodocyclaceae bacterium]
MKYASIIKEIGRGAKGAKGLSRDAAQQLFGHMLDGEVPDMELGAVLLAMRIKGEDAEELAGFKAALDARTHPVAVPHGPRCVVLPTYNGARKQANLMPLVAILLARQGVPVLIQGRHDFDSRVSPFDLLAALNLRAASSVEAAENQLSSRGIACLGVPQLSLGLDRLLALRPRLGVRNSSHTLAKLLDPCPGRSVRVVAVTHPAYIDVMEQVLAAEGAHALLMRGTEGEAYASPRRRPRLLGFAQGARRVLFEQAAGDGDGGFEEACDVERNAAVIEDMLHGRQPIPQPVQDQVDALASLAREA